MISIATADADAQWEILTIVGSYQNPDCIQIWAEKFEILKGPDSESLFRLVSAQN